MHAQDTMTLMPAASQQHPAVAGGPLAIPHSDSTASRVEESAARLDGWLRGHAYRAYDPFDGLNSWLRPLAFGTLGRQLLQQGVRRFPLNLRPLLGVKPSESSKGFGFLASAYLKLHAVSGRQAFLDQATNCLEWLIKNASSQYSGMHWGNHFDYQSRVFYLPKGKPTIVWVAHIGQAFMDAWDATQNDRYLHVAREACTFMLDGLERRREGHGVCLSYVPGEFRSVHNANILGAALLARVAATTGEDALHDVARDAVDYTVGAQLPDGAWWYGESDNLHWIDSFHTGYVLDSLWCYLTHSDDARHLAAFGRGADYFVASFFLPDGTPAYYNDRVWPIDIQCAAQAIDTLVVLSKARQDPAMLDLAGKVADWTIAHMQDPTGYFYFRKLPHFVNRTPTLHWGQATMLHALASLLQEKRGHEH